MRRQKKPKLVIAFNTTTNALAFEDICKLGRLIPLPSEIRARCGFAYCAPLEFEDEINKMLQTHNIEYFAKQIIELY